MNPILLALSPFQRSDRLVQKTFQLVKQEDRKLIVLFVVDINFTRYLIVSQTIAGKHFRQKCQEELLTEYKEHCSLKGSTMAGIVRNDKLKK